MAARRYPPYHAPGIIYLLHFSARTTEGHQHYLGWTSDGEARLGRHRRGGGAQETKKAIAEGLTLTEAQTWRGTPALEKRLKEWHKRKRKGFSGICPLCPGETMLPPDLVRELGAPSLRVRYLREADGPGVGAQLGSGF
jgi:predicted GIY-YIG superfamily endonuclease